MRKKNCVAHVFCAALLLTSAAAFGQSPSEASQPAGNAKQEAARRFEHAIKLYEDSDYVLALAEFERVYELVPDYRVLYNIGQVNIQLGRYARALRALREYVSRGGDELPADRRSSVQSDTRFLEARTATIDLDVKPLNAEVLIDGVVVGRAPLAEPVVVDVGERSLQIRLSGYVTRNQTLTLAGGDQRQVSQVLEREAVAAPSGPRGPVGAASTPRPAPARGSSWLWVGWTATGALAASSAVSAALGASAASDLADLRDSGGASRSALDDAKSRAQTRLLVADVLGVAAVAAGATTLYFQLSAKPRQADHASTHVQLRLLPNWVALRIEH
jgi:PEGA domain